MNHRATSKSSTSKAKSRKRGDKSLTMHPLNWQDAMRAALASGKMLKKAKKLKADKA